MEYQKKAILDFDGYFIDTDGCVWNKTRILKPLIDNDGYPLIRLFKDKKRFHKKVHRLMAEHFIPKIEGKETVDHINRDRTDNRLCNLRWADMSDQTHNTSRQQSSMCNITLMPSKNYLVRITIHNKTYRKTLATLQEAQEYLKSVKEQ